MEPIDVILRLARPGRGPRTTIGEPGGVKIYNGGSDSVTVTITVQGWYSLVRAVDAALEPLYRQAATAAGLTQSVIDQGIFLGDANDQVMQAILVRAESDQATAVEREFLMSLGWADIQLPETGAQAAELTSSVGTMTMEIPAEGNDLGQAGSVVFSGTSADTSLAVNDTEGGVQALVHIDSAAAPERFDFPLGGDVVSLRATDAGEVEALNAAGAVIATAPAPWATDASGVAVPTHYEIDGTTLTQVVEHHAGNVTYPIVADPWWNPFSWNWGKIWNKSKSSVASALKKCGKGALIGTFGLGITTGTTNVLITKYGSGMAMMKVGGIYGYIGAATAGCIMGQFT